MSKVLKLFLFLVLLSLFSFSIFSQGASNLYLHGKVPKTSHVDSSEGGVVISSNNRNFHCEVQSDQNTNTITVKVKTW
ncbi:hypothetical protein SpiGrapes_1187 [Sphaerochaeta pleomorpha str. Grapes]|uniref:Uncharacterized protein n=1 Tax=Sphaerochaeta pleomorpha (strain ATCC BAA-1885 / DSM 22778 / Grapes) TaxID=158190 RepID=G8QSP3_SPHPG|nr:hypothetical protein [Sphaerochaeta pleomorpha]AEV29004.1 hypothetical protein SpiGrapes_1187 [Sphaerochaeta pleomorpha str. Grapes]